MEKVLCGIYKITSPSSKVYIGQSTNIKRRFNEYYKLKCKGQKALYWSFNKYGIENHIFEIIEECNAVFLNDRERYYQELYDVLNKGLNCRITKSNDKSGVMSNEVRKKMSLKATGRKHSEETKNKMSSSQKGRKHSEETKIRMGLKSKGHKRGLGSKHTEETKIKMSLKSRGRKHTDESKLKLSIAHKGKKHSEESKLKMGKWQKGKSKSKDWIEKISESRKKIIMDIQTGVFYIGIKDACKSIDMKKSTLASKLNGTNKNNTNLIYV
jgi:group I intron endonuclease